MTGQAMTPEVIAAVFCAVLDLDDVRPSDSFFDIGGSSFTALTLVAKLNAGSGRMLRLRDLFRESTPSGLAKVIAALPLSTAEPAAARPPHL